MKLSLSFVGLMSAVLFVAVHAAPTPACGSDLCAQVNTRSLDGLEYEDLVYRTKSSGSNKVAISDGIKAAQKQQAANIAKDTRKTNSNKKVMDKAVGKAAAPIKKFREDEKAKGTPLDKINKGTDRLRNQVKGKAVADAQAAAKQARTEKWAAAKGKPNPNPGAPNSRPTKEMRHNVKQRFQAAKTALGNTKDVPKRTDSFSVGKDKADGKAVRQAAFNTHLHSKTPIGRNADNTQPKPFNNRPYAASHPDPALAGKKPLAQNGKEYPIKNNSPNGWTGSGPVGAMRTVTTKEKGQKRVNVIGHDASRGGDKDDHYVATKTSRSLFDYDLEDLE